MSVTLTCRFNAIVPADAFKNLKPPPDFFLAASKILGVLTSKVIVKALCYIRLIIERFSLDLGIRVFGLDSGKNRSSGWIRVGTDRVRVFWIGKFEPI